MNNHPYFFYADLGLVTVVEPDKYIWLSANIQNKHELFHHIHAQLPEDAAAVLEPTWDGLGASLEMLAFPKDGIQFSLIHEQLPALPTDEQKAYLDVLQQYSLRCKGQNSNLTAFFPIKDIRPIQALYDPPAAATEQA